MVSISNQINNRVLGTQRQRSKEVRQANKHKHSRDLFSFKQTIIGRENRQIITQTVCSEHQLQFNCLLTGSTYSTFT